MKIRIKIALISSLVAILILIFVSILTNTITLNGFLKVENSNMIKDVARVNDALLEKLQSVDSTTHDYATWDTTYYGSAKETAENSPLDIKGSLQNTNMDFNVILRNDGKIVSAMDIFSGEEKYYNATTSDLDTRTFYYYFEKNYASLICQNASVYFSELIQMPSGIALISARPVLKSDGTGPVEATIIFGKMIDESFIKKLSEQTHLSFSIHPYDSVSYEDKLKLNMLFSNSKENTVNNIKSEQNIIRKSNESNGSNFNKINLSVQVLALDKENISGNTLLKDMFGKPVALLTIVEPRTIYLEGKNAVNRAFQMMLLVVILFIILEYWLFNRFIISRLISMEHQMRDIHTKKMLSSRITILGKDELSSFGEAVNSALNTIEKTIEEKQAVFEADPDTYFYTDSLWKIIDYKTTDASDIIVHNKNISELKNLYLSDLFDSNIMSKLSKAKLESIKSRKPVILNLNVPTEDNSKVFEARIVAINNNNNNCLILLSDITDRKKFEQQLLEKNNDLEKFNKFALDRELKMSELKKEIHDLQQKKDEST